jgi:hypothetical protein
MNPDHLQNQIRPLGLKTGHYAISRRERLPQSELVRIACRAFYGIAEPRQALAHALANTDAPWLSNGRDGADG